MLFFIDDCQDVADIAGEIWFVKVCFMQSLGLFARGLVVVSFVEMCIWDILDFGITEILQCAFILLPPFQ